MVAQPLDQLGDPVATEAPEHRPHGDRAATPGQLGHLVQRLTHLVAQQVGTLDPMAAWSAAGSRTMHRPLS
ncbi:hypothetical protein BJF80_09515 [Serinicoccus sp. CUA-874]|nr:hypothetical protein BJF80_09515 [Serinicoccus sp. CUA-874]